MRSVCCRFLQIAAVLSAVVVSLWGAGPSKPSPSSDVARDIHGDALPPGAVGRLGTVRWRHAGNLAGVAFSPDGKTVASTGSDGVRLWDATNGKAIRQLAKGTGNASLAFSPDGRWLASGSKVVRLWETATGKEVRTLAEHVETIRCVAFSPDGRLLATASDDKTARLWETATGKEVRALLGHERQVFSITFSPDGRLLATGSWDKTVRLWEAATGKEVRRLPPQQKTQQNLYSVAFSPDGQLLAASGGYKVVRLAETATGKEVRQVPTRSSSPYALAFSPDGRLLAVTEDFYVRLWETATGAEHLRLEVRWPHGVAFSADGRWLASGGRYERTVQLWETASGKELPQPPGHQGIIDSIAFSPDGRLVASASADRTVRLWDRASGKQLQRFEVRGRDLTFNVAFSPDSRLVVLAGGYDKALRMWETATGNELPGQPGWVRQAVFSASGRMVSAGGQVVQVWESARDTEPRRLHRLPKEAKRAQVNALAISADGQTLAVASNEGPVWLWEADTGKMLHWLQGHKGKVNSVSISPDGRLLASGGQDNSVRLWETATGKELRQLAGAGPDFRGTHAVAFSPDGRLLAAALAAGQSVRLWETATGQLRRDWAGQEGTALAFSPDGRCLAASQMDTTIALWDIFEPKTDQPIQGLTGQQVLSLWEDLASLDAGRASDAMAGFLTSPAASVGILRMHLQPAKPFEPERLARLIAGLESDDFAARQKAEEELEKLGELAQPALRKALQGQPALDLRRRLERLLEKLHIFVTDPERLRQLRGVEILEHLATPEARAVLESLAAGADGARLTTEAKASLQRLDRRRPSTSR